jgi:choline-sulfatase
MGRRRSGRARPAVPSPASGGTAGSPVTRQARGSRLSAVAIAALLAAGAGAWGWLRTPAFAVGVNADRNILLVTIDTLRADALGAYGGRAVTPNLDRLAASGGRFTFAHAHAVVTLPSHATILTGRYPYEHGIRDNTGYRARPDQATAATLLKVRGFATAAFTGGFPLDHRFGLNAGFDVYDDTMDSGGEDRGERERRADAVVRPALDWIGARPGKWFAWVHLYDPHAPYRPPTEWAARFPSDPYLGEVSWTDAALAPLFDRIAALPRPTLVVVTADHGESLGEHGEPTHGIFAYESTLHVPLIVAELGASRRGRASGVVVDAPVRHVDLLPTLLDAAGAPAVPGLPGASLRPLIAGELGPDRPGYFEAMMTAVTRGWAPLRGVVAGREKYIDLPIHELYDLTADPGETTNRAPQSPARAGVLLNTLLTFDMSPPARARQETADTVERLRSLGYIGGGSAPQKASYGEADDPKRLIGLEQLMQHAADAYNEGRVPEAIEMYRSVIEKRADTEDAYRRLAFIFWRTGRPADAIATLESALRHGVTQPEVRNKLGQYLAETGQPRRAIALLEHDTGDDPDALIALGNSYQLAGRDADALKTFTRLVELDPAGGLGYENLGIAQLKGGDRASAEASLRKAIERDPSLGGAYTALGVVLAGTDRRPAAIDAWKRAVDLDGHDVNALFNLTLNLLQSGRHDEAREYGARFIRVAPTAMKADVETIRRAIAQPAGG